jgi:ribosome-binding ATPase YchF (GTP1/OBG family)
MKDNCEFVRNLKKVIGQIRDEKLFIDSSIEKILQELDDKKKENQELLKINRALEELNLAIEKEFQETKSTLARRQKEISKCQGKNLKHNKP